MSKPCLTCGWPTERRDEWRIAECRRCGRARLAGCVLFTIVVLAPFFTLLALGIAEADRVLKHRDAKK